MVVGDRTISRRTKTSGSYMSAQTDSVHFGLGDIALIDQAVVSRTNGRVSNLTDIATNQTITFYPDGRTEFITSRE